jgi:hypothetical protein
MDYFLWSLLLGFMGGLAYVIACVFERMNSNPGDDFEIID